MKWFSFLKRWGKNKYPEELCSKKIAPIKTLSAVIRLLHTLYQEGISIRDAEMAMVEMHHATIVDFLNAVDNAIDYLKTGKLGVRRVNSVRRPLTMSLYDFCDTGDKVKYISTDRLLPLVYDALKDLNYNLQHIEEDNVQWQYVTRLIKHIALDARALATQAYQIKDAHGKEK